MKVGVSVPLQPHKGCKETALLIQGSGPLSSTELHPKLLRHVLDMSEQDFVTQGTVEFKASAKQRHSLHQLGGEPYRTRQSLCCVCLLFLTFKLTSKVNSNEIARTSPQKELVKRK